MKLTYDQLMTVGEFRERLADMPAEAKLYFGAPSLEFFRLKWRGPGLLQVEFSQTVYEDEKGNVFVDNWS